MTGPVLSVNAIDVFYGASQILFGVGLQVHQGQTVALLGRNGAGKSTLLKALAGELRAWGGEIRFGGARTNEQPTERRAREGIGYVPQEDAIFGRLTVRENLLLGAASHPDRHGIPEVLDFFPKLAQRLDQQAATLSGGERKMLAIGRALLGRPRLLMLDEPTEGVWIGVIEEIATRLERLCQTMAVLLVEQHVELALRVAQYAYVMDRGTVAMEGPTQELRGDERLFRYLAP